MPTATWTALATITLTSNDAEITFSSIPNTYRDLVVIAHEKNTTGTAGFRCYLNGDTGNATQVSMDSSGSALSATQNIMNVSVSENDFGTTILHIMDYSATDKHKIVLGRGNAKGSFVRAAAGRWASTNAVTSLTLTTAGYDFVSGSTFTLYGIVS